MSKFLSGQLAKQLADGMKSAGLPLSGTLKRATATGYDSYNDPTYTYTSYTFQGFEDGYSDIRRQLDGIPQDDRNISILADTLSVTPEIGDYVQLTGYAWKQVKSVQTDPAKAVWQCQCGDASDPEA